MSDNQKYFEAQNFWAGEFGTEYTRRNRVSWRHRISAFANIIINYGIRSVAEVGCNAGWNLTAIQHLNSHIKLSGCDVNVDAIEEAKSAGLNVELKSSNEFLTQRMTNGFIRKYDLVFTSGVLIHIPTEFLPEVMVNIVNASNRYVLAIEYYSGHEEEIPYRGHDGRLWRRNYGLLYEEMGLKCIDKGFFDKENGFDNCNWWLLEKA